MYYIFIEKTSGQTEADSINATEVTWKINGAGECPCVDDNTVSFEVSKELYSAFLLTPDKYIYQNGDIVENPDYELIKRKKEISEKIDEIKLELDDIDSKRIRAVCENEVKDSGSGGTWLDYYNHQVLKLREELDSLEAQL